MKYYIAITPVESGGWKASAYTDVNDRYIGKYSMFSETAPTKEDAKKKLEDKINHIHQKPLCYTLDKTSEEANDDTGLS